MRAREPEVSGYVQRDGVRIYYESHGDGGEPIVFVPTDVFVTGEMWKAQVPYLARRHRVVVIDPRGNGRSDKPTDPDAYTDREMVADLIAVMDELGIDRAVLGGLCEAAYYSLAAAAWHPDRAAGVIAVAPWAADGTPRADRGTDVYDDVEACWNAPDTGQQGWEMLNREVWLRDWPLWPAFFFGQMVNDPHSSKVYEDLVGWSCQSNGPAQVAAGETTSVGNDPATTAALLAGVRCPVLVIHGTLDFCQPLGRGAHLARMTGGELLALGDAGHVPTGRDPVPVNHAIADFVRRVHAGEAVAGRGSTPHVRAHLSTRSDPPPPLGPATRIGRATRYGDDPPGVVVLPASGADAAAWAAQLPGVSRQLPLLVLDDDVTDAATVRDILRAAEVRDAVLLAPPGTADLAAELARDTDQLAGIVLVQAREALRDQPGLAEFFVHRLPREKAPAAIVRALADTSVTDEDGRAPILAVLDDQTTDPGPADVLVTVEGGVAPPSPHRRRRHRDRRVLYLSSPIGLGHVRRDLAIADALRRQVDGLRVDWLTQPPVATFLQRRGERVHPASAFLAAES
ncbi:MAG TPA: alpha/beta fold hydrolase, partial [Nakamurella sp.]|nr:alpha/beta fold hydrolase [Nakamurella sp.]